MAYDISIETAHLMGFPFAMLLYGAYVVIFAVTMRLLVLREKKNRSMVVLGVMLGLFLTTTTSIVLCVIDNYNGWIRYRDSPGTSAYFLQQNGIRVTKDLLLLAAALLADGLICWRLHVIWSKRTSILIVPGLLLLAEAGVGIVVITLEYYELWANDGRFTTFFKVGPFIICIASAIVNILVTTLICGRLWYVGREVQDIMDRDRYARVIHALIESGFLYTATILVYFVCVISGMSGIYRLVDYLETVIVAIAPTLIILLLNYTRFRRRSLSDIPTTAIRFQSPTDISLDGVSPIYDPDVLLPTPVQFPTLPLPAQRPISPGSVPPTSFQVKLSHAASSSTLSMHSPSSPRWKGRLRTSSSQPTFPIGLGYSELSLPHTEGVPDARASAVRESWHTAYDLRETSAEDVEAGSPTVQEDPVVEEIMLPPLPAPLPSSPTSPRLSPEDRVRRSRAISERTLDNGTIIRIEMNRLS